MKTPRNPDDDSVLLDAILTDESWAALDNALRRDALASLRGRRRQRRIRMWSGALCAAAVLLVTVLHWLLIPNMNPVNPKPKLAAVMIRNFREDELLALFPKGSCICAEVDGQPRFFVLDEKLAAQGLAAQ